MKKIVSSFIGVRNSVQCPHCNSEMQRITRKKWHRIISKIKPIVRMRCCDQEHLVERSTYKLHQNPPRTANIFPDNVKK